MPPKVHKKPVTQVLKKPVSSVKTKSIMITQNIAKQLYEKNMELLVQRRRTEQLLYNVSEIVIAIDKTYKITFFNEITEHILDIKDVNAIIGTSVEQLIKLQNEKEEPLNIKKYCFIENPRNTHIEDIVMITPTDKRYVNLTTSTLKFPDGKSECLITITDITKEKKLEILKDEFLSVASHELRTPMTVIKGYMWMLDTGKGGKLSIKQKEYVKVVMENSERMTTLINEMLDISRMEKGTIQFKTEKIDVVKEVKDITKELKIRTDQQNIYLKVLYKENETWAFTDKTKFREIILNLVGNSIKFTKQGGITIQIDDDPKFVKISVIDTGAGLVAEDIPRLFHKFGRLDNSYQTVAETGGSGLGLYIVKLYVEKMGGHVGAESEGVMKGSNFWFTLPKNPVKN